MLNTNFLKKMLAVAMVIALSATSCALTKKEYVIKGSSRSADGTKIMFYNYMSQTLLDSAVVTKGAFEFKGTVEEPFVGYIDETNAQQMLIVEPGQIKVVMGEEGSVSGTTLNKSFEQYNAKLNAIIEPILAKADELKTDDTKSDEQKQEAMSELSEQYSKAMEEFSFTAIKENNNIIGIYYFASFVGSSSDSEYFDKIAAIAGDNVKASDAYAKTETRFQAVKKVGEGKMFADFTIENGKLDGTSVSLSDFVGKGKYILVDFWASWCNPCRAEIPNIKENYIKYAGEEFDVLSVAVWDKRAATLKAIEEEQLPWNQIIDAQSIPSDLYGFNGIPCIMLFAPDGTIYSTSLRGEEIGNTLQKIFNK